MTPSPYPTSPGLYGDGLVCGPDGAPLRPGGPALTEVLLDLAGYATDALVVDVGCGQGASVETMLRRGLIGIGVDIAAETLARAHERLADGIFIVAGADDLPFADASIDGVLAECSLSTMPDRRRVLDEWFRVLRPGGRLALSDVYRRALGPDQVSASTDFSPLVSWRSLARDVAGAGFRIEWFEDRSDALRNWVARFVFAYGSLEALWGGACGLTGEAVRMASPGYFLMIADRPGDGAGEIRA